MKIYKCRCTKHTKKWIEISAYSPQTAAGLYAERCFLEYPDIITVMGVGRFTVYVEKIYSAEPIWPREKREG